jgi:hypothetical protein
MEFVIVVGADVTAWEGVFEVLEESGIDAHNVLEVAVLLAVLDHKDLAVALNDLGLDLASALGEEDLVREFAVNDLLTDLRDAPWAEGVSGARPAESRAGLLIRFKQRLIGPSRNERGIRLDAVERVE